MHGQVHSANLCTHFVFYLFVCLDIPPHPTLPSTTQTLQLDHFITYALHHMQLHSSVTFAVLHLLQCLKAHFPTAKGSSSHQPIYFSICACFQNYL